MNRVRKCLLIFMQSFMQQDNYFMYYVPGAEVDASTRSHVEEFVNCFFLNETGKYEATNHLPFNDERFWP